MKKIITPSSIWRSFKSALLTAIALAFLLSANQSEAFSDGKFIYTVLTENPWKFEGTVSVSGFDSRFDPTLSGAVYIPHSAQYGSMVYYVTSIGDWAFRDCSSLTSITIPNYIISKYAITNIGGGAFSGCNGLTNVVIGNGVTSIGYSAFSGCGSLSSIEIPDRVINIGYGAFSGCGNLTEIVVSKNNRYYSSLDGVLFNEDKTTLIQYPGGKSGTSYTIPNSVTNIGGRAFSGCNGLTNVVIGNGVTSIGGWAFYDCSSLTSITIPAGISHIGEYAFAETSLSAVYFRGLPPQLGKEAFPKATKLYYIEGTPGWAIGILDGYQTAIWEGEHTPVDPTFTDDNFKYTVLTLKGTTNTVSVSQLSTSPPSGAVTIPRSVKCGLVTYSVTSIGLPYGPTVLKGGAFEDCTSLTNITIPDTVTSIGGGAFKGCSKLKSITIPNSVTKILAYAFQSSGLKSITIPDSVTEIGCQAFYLSSLTNVVIGKGVTSVGSDAFYWCFDLTEITVSKSNPYYSSLQGVLFNKAQSTLIKYPNGKSGTYTIPDSVTKIEFSAFNYCGKLTSVVIGNSITSIGNGFMYCSRLSNITIPASVSSIGAGVFNGTPLSAAYFRGLPPQLGKEAFPQTTKLYYIKGTHGWTTPTWKGYQTATWNTVGDSFTDANFRYTVLSEQGTTGTVSVARQSESVPSGEVTISGSVKYLSARHSVTSIRAKAFDGCSSLMSIRIPDSVTSIGEKAFQNCRGLTTVTIPNSVTRIEGGTFYGCSSLTSIKIPDSVTSIGDWAFRDCSSLTSITIPNSVTDIGDLAFYGCSNLTSVMIGNSVISIGDLAFEGCSGLTSITIPASVSHIGESAFEGTSLSAAYFRGSPPDVDEEPFPQTTILYYIEGTPGWTTPTWKGYQTATWIPVDPPALSFEVKGGKLILTYSDGELEESGDLILWSPVEGAQGSKYEVDVSLSDRKFYRVVK